MITEDYCSFEVAKLLKEKGFEGDIRAYYHIWDNDNKVCSIQEFSHSEAPHLYVPAPTHQMAMKWLREDKHIFIEIKKSSNTFLYGASIMKDCSRYYSRILNAYNTYEEVVEAALKYCLENLI